MGLLYLEDVWVLFGFLVKFAVIIAYIYGRKKLRSWAVFLAGVTAITSVFGLLTDPSIYYFIDVVGLSLIFYYIFKIDK